MPAAPLGRLARSARAAKPANLAAVHEPRRTATLAALFQTLEAALDGALELFEALMTDIFRQAEKAYRTSRLRSLRDLDAAAIILRELGRQVMADGSTRNCAPTGGGCALCFPPCCDGSRSMPPQPASRCWRR